MTSNLCKTVDFLERTQLVLQWAQHLLQGEFISAPRYTENFIAFEGTVSQADLERIVDIVDAVLTHTKAPLRVACNMAEIVPIWKEPR